MKSIRAVFQPDSLAAASALHECPTNPMASVSSSATYRTFGSFRFLLAVVVVLGHATWLAPDFFIANVILQVHAASTAVLAFFVLSGFILSEAATTFYRRRPGALLKNRIVKIMPAFLGALIISVAVHLVLDRFDLMLQGIAFEGYKEEPETMWGKKNLFYNPVSVLPFLHPDKMHKNIGEIYLFVRYVWAINVEMMFYIAIAFFVSLGKYRDIRVSTWVFATGTVIFALLYLTFIWKEKSNFYIPYAPCFLLGVSILGASKSRVWIVPLIGSAVLSLLCAARLISGGNVLRDLSLVTLPVVLGVVLFAAFASLVFLLSRIQIRESFRDIDRYLGDLSYALYLNHYIVLVVFCALAGIGAGIVYWFAALATSIVLAGLMQRLIEYPLARLRARIRGTVLD